MLRVPAPNVTRSPAPWLAADDAVNLRLQRFCHGAERARAHGDLVDRANGCDFGGGAGEENFVGDVEGFSRNLLLNDLDAEVARNLQHRVARDAGEYRTAKGRRMQHAVADDKQILARTFADEAVHIRSA